MAAVRGVKKLYGIGLHAIRQNTALRATTLLQQRSFRVGVSLKCMNVAYNVTQRTDFSQQQKLANRCMNPVAARASKHLALFGL